MPDARRVAEAAHHAGGVGALIVLHFAGYPSPLGELALAAGVPLGHVVEDAAHALGAEVGGRRIGASSTITCFSFDAAQNLPIGDGGMITTDQQELARRIRWGRQRHLDRDGAATSLATGRRHGADLVGHDSTLTDVEAAIGRAHLLRVDEWQQRRELLARRYDENLDGIRGLVRPASPTSARHAWHLYVAQVGPEYGLTRDQLVAELADRGIETSVPVGPVHHRERVQEVLDPLPPLPDADTITERIVALPLHPGLDYDAVDLVCEAIVELQPAVHRRGIGGMCPASRRLGAEGPDGPGCGPSSWVPGRPDVRSRGTWRDRRPWG